jgi:hypothetical protein
MSIRIREMPPLSWMILIYGMLGSHAWGALRHWPVLDEQHVYSFILWFAVALCWLPGAWAVSPAGVERRWGRWRVWSVSWEDYAGWRWVTKTAVFGRRRAVAPVQLVISNRRGRYRLITLYGQRLEGERVVPGKAASRLIEALWEHGPHIGIGWQQTVDYYERVSTAEATDEFPAVTAPR